ncbi:hypothetical protein T12_10012 [Trichinella patagoniensis]|uniref:Uncharacterized protein n=1 Tax=Trichinella patagoniensis TaxID=990121 RepID=A0A0V0ZXV1_9BILA|nr:hypothetical protein T12_10012 [Trichinella patagoniensis]
MKYLSKKTLNLTVKVKNLATFSLIGKDMNNTLKLVYETFSASFKNNFHPKALPMLRGSTEQQQYHYDTMLWKERMRFFIGICEFLILFTLSKRYHFSCTKQVQARRNTHFQLYMFLSHIEYLLECNTLAVNSAVYLYACKSAIICQAAFSGIKVTKYKKTRIPLTGTKNVATKLALDGPFVYGQHLMILALD